MISLPVDTGTAVFHKQAPSSVLPDTPHTPWSGPFASLIFTTSPLPLSPSFLISPESTITANSVSTISDYGGQAGEDCPARTTVSLSPQSYLDIVDYVLLTIFSTAPTSPVVKTKSIMLSVAQHRLRKSSSTPTPRPSMSSRLDSTSSLDVPNDVQDQESSCPS